jgi:hypothetical protein
VAIHHQGSFIKRDLLIKQGGYNTTTLRIASDAVFAMDAIFKNHATTRYINSIFALYDNCGASARSMSKYLQELKKSTIDIFQSRYWLIYAQFICWRKHVLMYSRFILRMQRLGIKKTAEHYINRLFRGGKNA